MNVLLTLLLASGCLCVMVWGSMTPSEKDDFEDLVKGELFSSSSSPSSSNDAHQLSPPSSRSHNIVLRQTNPHGFSLLALGAFSVFIKYLVYHFITKNSGEDRRSLEDNLLDLTRITACLKEGDFMPDFHLHCFFPSYLSREDNDIISEIIWGKSDENSVVRVPRPNKNVKSLKENEQQFHEKFEPETRSHRVKRKPAGTVISMLALASFGIFFFYFVYYNISKYLGEESRSLSPDPVEDYLREMTSILQCLQEEDFTPRFECFKH